MYQRGKIINRKKKEYFPVPVSRAENLVSRDRFGRPVLRQSAQSPNADRICGFSVLEWKKNDMIR